jgi:hypothetical protein
MEADARGSSRAHPVVANQISLTSHSVFADSELLGWIAS